MRGAIAERRPKPESVHFRGLGAEGRPTEKRVPKVSEGKAWACMSEVDGKVGSLATY